MPFDGRNGVVFTETVLQPHSTCPSHPRAATLKQFSLRNARLYPGKSLQHMSIRRILHDPQAITYDLLRRVPETIQAKLWEAVCQEHLLDLNVWKQFAGVYPYSSATCYHWDITCRCYSLHDLVATLNSKSHRWDVDVIVGSGTWKSLDILALRDLNNLTILRIYDHGVSFDDRIVRACVRSSENLGFSNLKILVLFGQSGLTKIGIELLAQLPRLKYIVTQRCGFQAGKSRCEPLLGWQVVLNMRDCPELDHLLSCGKARLRTLHRHVHEVDAWPGGRVHHPVVQVNLDTGVRLSHDMNHATGWKVLERDHSAASVTHQKRESADLPAGAEIRRKRRAAPQHLEADLNAMITST